MLEKIKNTNQKYGLIARGDKIIVGVSGGPDSVALLDILFLLQQELNISLYVAHLNHGFRPEALEEAQYVKMLAQKYGLGCTIRDFNVPAFIQGKGLSIQEGAREIRYSFFQEVAREVNANKIAVGHHADDQAETVLSNFLRGSGLKGLGGIAPQRANIIRPLIELKRQEIEDYCLKRELKTYLDASNLKTIYRRNKIRLELIPFLEKEYNPQLRQGLANMAEVLRDEDSFLSERVTLTWNELIREADPEKLDFELSGFNSISRAIQRRIISKAWATLAQSSFGLSWEHVERSLLLIQEGQDKSRLQLPANVFVCLHGNDILAFTITREEKHIPPFNYPLPLPGLITVNEIELTIKTVISPRNPLIDYGRKFFLDYDSLPKGITLRNRRTGDLWKSAGGTKKLKEFFIDLKLPKEKRDAVPLVAAGEQIIWAGGIGPAYLWRVTPKTRRVLEIQMEPVVNS